MFSPEHIGIFILILLIALVVFGGSRLSGVGGALGKSVREFRSEVQTDKSDESDATSSSS